MFEDEYYLKSQMAVLQQTVELLAEKYKNDGEVQGVAGNSQQE